MNDIIKELENVCYQAGQQEEQKKFFLARIGNLDTILAKANLSQSEIEQYCGDHNYLTEKYSEIIAKHDELADKRKELRAELNNKVKEVLDNG